MANPVINWDLEKQTITIRFLDALTLPELKALASQVLTVCHAYPQAETAVSTSAEERKVVFHVLVDSHTYNVDELLSILQALRG